MFKLLPIKGHGMNKKSAEIFVQQKPEQKKRQFVNCAAPKNHTNPGN
jgi:hypothetical protein